MVHASLFSGIGGPEVAAAMLGWQNAFHCEINDFGRSILEYWFPNSVSYEDITKTDFREWRGRIDVLTGGFPCQPFSYAGRRGGQKTTVTSGRRCCELLTKSGPLGLLVKTLLVSPLWSKEGYLLTWEAKPLCSKRVTTFTDTNLSRPSPLNESAKTWNVSDIPSSRCLFRLRLSEHPIDETESSLSPIMIGTPTTQNSVRSERFRRSANPNPGELAARLGESIMLQTPTVVMTCQSPETMRARAERNGYQNGTQYASLESQIMYDPKCAALLPTPQTSDCQEPLTPEQKEAYVAKWKEKGIVPSAAYQLRQQAVEGLLPTPIAGDWKGQVKGEGKGPETMLCGVVETAAKKTLLPTPRANKVTDADLSSPKIAARNKSNIEEEVAKMVQGLILPTPTCNDAINQSLPKSQEHRNDSIVKRILKGEMGVSVPKKDGQPFRLTPLFTEEMMGFPFLWTTFPFLRQSGEPNPSKPTATP